LLLYDDSVSDTRIVTAIHRRSLPGTRQETSTALSFGSDISWQNLQAVCPDGKCEVGLVFQATELTCQPGTPKHCNQQTRFEFRIPTDLSAAPQLLQINEIVEPDNTNKVTKTVLATFADVSLDLSQPQNFRITRFGNDDRNLLISLPNNQRLCVGFHRVRTILGLQAGLSWRSSSQGKGRDWVRLSHLAMAAPPFPVSCYAPLPPL